MAEMAVLEVYFEHLYTDVNSVRKRDVNSSDLLSALRPNVAHLCSLQ